MNSAIKYRLYPTSEQKIMFAKTFGCCRKVYNLMLAEKIESYKTTGKFVAVTPAKYKKDFPYLNNLTYYLFESNHDPKMLYESKRPDYLIRRIISDTGHMSNLDCGYYLSTFIGDDTKEIVLAHLSDECNTPEIAMKTLNDVFLRQLGYIPEVVVKAASDKEETKGGR